MILKPRLFRKPNLSHPLAQGLVGYWLMNEGAGGIVQDLSGKNNHGTFGAGAASPIWVPGKFGPSVSYDGGDYITIADKTNLSGMAQLSIVVWIWAAAGAQADNYACIVSKLGANIYAIFQNGSNNQLSYYTKTTVGQIGSAGGTNFFNGSWRQLVFVYDGAFQYVYEDSIQVDKDAQTGTILVDTSSLIFGSELGTKNYFNGLIDDIMIYNRALSGSEVAELFRNPFAMFKRSPIELWTGAMGGGGAPPSQTILDYERKTRGVNRGVVRGAA